MILSNKFFQSKYPLEDVFVFRMPGKTKLEENCFYFCVKAKEVDHKGRQFDYYVFIRERKVFPCKQIDDFVKAGGKIVCNKIKTHCLKDIAQSEKVNAPIVKPALLELKQDFVKANAKVSIPQLLKAEQKFINAQINAGKSKNNQISLETFGF